MIGFGEKSVTHPKASFRNNIEVTKARKLSLSGFWVTHKELRYLRVYLKTGNMRGGEGFSA